MSRLKSWMRKSWDEVRSLSPQRQCACLVLPSLIVLAALLSPTGLLESMGNTAAQEPATSPMQLTPAQPRPPAVAHTPAAPAPPHVEVKPQAKPPATRTVAAAPAPTTMKAAQPELAKPPKAVQPEPPPADTPKCDRPQGTFTDLPTEAVPADKIPDLEVVISCLPADATVQLYHQLPNAPLQQTLGAPIYTNGDKVRTDIKEKISGIPASIAGEDDTSVTLVLVVVGKSGLEDSLEQLPGLGDTNVTSQVLPDSAKIIGRGTLNIQRP